MEEVALKNPWADLIYAEDIRSKMKVPDQIILGSNARGGKEARPVKTSPKKRLFATSPTPPTTTNAVASESLEESTPNNNVSAISTNGGEMVAASPSNNSVIMEISRDTYKPELHGSPLQEIQLLRKQVAKMNHRLMAVELQNQQQSQRELLLTGAVSAFIIFKVITWLSRV